MRNIIGQQMIIGLRGPSLLPDEKKFIIDNNIGGVILFDRNLESPEQIHALTSELQSLRNQMRDKAPLFISIDMEGGRVHRMKDPFTKWPAACHLGSIGSSSLAFRFALNMGEELRAFGVNLDFAPCVDVFLNEKNEVIGDRAISSDAQVVSQVASALVRGYIKSGVIPCSKHFPGHGSVEVDSHLALPISDKGLKELDETQELEPFKKIFKSRCELTMTAHIKYPSIDPEWPVTLSPIFLQHILRGALRYRGLIITDDLDMNALSKNFPQTVIPVQSLRAGANILLYCNNFNSPVKAIDHIMKAVQDKEIDNQIIEKNHSEIIQFKKKKISTPYDPFPLKKAMEIIERQEHKEFAAAIATEDVEKFIHQTNEA